MVITRKDLLPDEQYDYLDSWTTRDKDQWVADTIGLSRARDELALFGVKWFDYRTIHPFDATALFCEAYKRAYSQIMQAHGRVDYVTAEFRTGLKRVPYTAQAASVRTSLWKARQTADRYGVEYDYFCNTILSIAASREWGELPRPQHMWQEDLLEILAEKLINRSMTRLMGSENPWFSTENYCGHEVQDAHRAHIIRLLEDRVANRTLAIWSAVKMHRWLDEQSARLHFPEETARACVF
ncbi:hypothetical protein MWH03_00055 [Klebsiella pneumoniae]|nr:hypothetical protein [Klebsiella pneumoniae]